MPEIELPDISTLGGSFLAKHKLDAYMTWPGDSEARKQYFASMVARAAYEAKHATNEQVISRIYEDLGEIAEGELIDIMREWLCSEYEEKYFHPHGGLKSVIEADSLFRLWKVVERNRKYWELASWVFLFLKAMCDFHDDLPGGPSLNKAVFLVERSKRIPKKLRVDKSDIWKSWSGFRSVAHLGASILFWESYLAKESDCDERKYQESLDDLFDSHMKVVLSRAKFFENFGSSFVPLRSKKPLFDDSIWRIPDKFQADHKYPIGPLSEADLNILKEYEAGKV